jgi:hypothetical protein
MKISLDAQTVLRLTGRAAFFLIAWTLILFLLFLIGNYQQFLDGNQRLIMRLLSVTLVLEMGAGLFYLLVLAFFRKETRHPGRGRVIILIITLAVSLILFVVLEFFHAWLQA